ncbi:MAG TPA: anti-sigma F factor [Bacillota bacterium]|nr:anti-sigma F factor [Bacillota bacterium]
MRRKKRYSNEMKLEFLSVPSNVAFARVAVAAFASQLDFTLAELEEIKVAVSEAVSNSIVHGYGNATNRFVKIHAALTADSVEIRVEDGGKGIENVDAALQPAFSTDADRLGLGFVFMQSFMDSLDVKTAPDQGTVVTMVKKLGAGMARTNPEQ